MKAPAVLNRVPCRQQWLQLNAATVESGCRTASLADSQATFSGDGRHILDLKAVQVQDLGAPADGAVIGGDAAAARLAGHHLRRVLQLCVLPAILCGVRRTCSALSGTGELTCDRVSLSTAVHLRLSAAHFKHSAHAKCQLRQEHLHQSRVTTGSKAGGAYQQMARGADDCGRWRGRRQQLRRSPPGSPSRSGVHRSAPPADLGPRNRSGTGTRPGRTALAVPPPPASAAAVRRREFRVKKLERI